MNHQTYLAGMKQIQVFALFMPLMELISAGAVALLIWYGGGQVIRQTLTLGALVAFLSYIQMFFRPLRELTEKYSVLQSAMASLERIFALMEEKTEEGPEETSFRRPDRVKGEIAFDQVSFAYQAEEWVLRDISFTIRPGEAVAIVGMTGGGKTTLIQLLEGFYTPQKGQIRIDGIPIQSFSKKFLRALVGLVPQEVFLFAGDLKENILLADKETLSSREAQEKIWEEIQPLFQDFQGRKVDTLSSGERQLVAMARVLARDPAILVLDEATAHLDAQTEEKVQAVLGKLLTGGPPWSSPTGCLPCARPLGLWCCTRAGWSRKGPMRSSWSGKGTITDYTSCSIMRFKTGVINGLFMVFSCHFSSSPSAFIGDPVVASSALMIPSRTDGGSDGRLTPGTVTTARLSKMSGLLTFASPAFSANPRSVEGRLALHVL